MGRVIVFVKAPRPGFAKSRLAESLDPEAAAAIYQVLLHRTVATLAFRTDVELRFTPADAEAEIASLSRPGWRLADQGPGDLGERMAKAVRGADADGALPVLLLGTDCPGLEPGDIDDAFAQLKEQDVVMGPAEDGGYWLLGLRGGYPDLFTNIPWSTPEVGAITLERARSAGLRVGRLRTLRDVDTLGDWREWLRSAPL